MKKAQLLKKVHLGPAFYEMQKNGVAEKDFGLDNSKELIGGGFGLYSTSNMAGSLGPVKTEFYRIAFTRAGSVNVNLGLEAFKPTRDTIVFGFPGQTFSLFNRSEDFFAYYILFTDEFIADRPSLSDMRERFPFMGYNGIQSFQLSSSEGLEVEQTIHKINDEIKARNTDSVRTIQLYTELILILANRSYERQQLAQQATAATNNALFKRFVKLVGQHFLRYKKVSDYAKLLHVSADHLNRTIKSQSDKTAHELIDEMILIEAKALLKQTSFSMAEIAYQLEFTDPSHFNKFFKKLAGLTPLQYRSG